MEWGTALLAAAIGLVIAVVTAPVGVSGAVFLLPIQLSGFNVPNPAVTPTNLLFNVVATPGALLRYARRGSLASPLTKLLLVGTLPGVVLGAVIRVYAVPGPQVFRVLVASVMLPLGVWLLTRSSGARAATGKAAGMSPRATTLSAGLVGVLGGIYGIGGGSILGPVLVGRGLPVAVVAPAALSSTFATSVVGSLTYALLALSEDGAVAPDWALGIACGLGGLVGGYLGAWLQPYLPENALRLLLGALAVGVALMYVVQVLS